MMRYGSSQCANDTRNNVLILISYNQLFSIPFALNTIKSNISSSTCFKYNKINYF